MLMKTNFPTICLRQPHTLFSLSRVSRLCANFFTSALFLILLFLSLSPQFSLFHPSTLLVLSLLPPLCPNFLPSSAFKIPLSLLVSSLQSLSSRSTSVFSSLFVPFFFCQIEWRHQIHSWWSHDRSYKFPSRFLLLSLLHLFHLLYLCSSINFRLNFLFFPRSLFWLPRYFSLNVLRKTSDKTVEDVDEALSFVLRNFILTL